jgi:Flp pilus assembly protein TadD
LLADLGELAWSLDDPADAAALLEEALARRGEPAPPAWRLRLADANARRGKMDEAVSEYRRALAGAADDADGWRGLARALEALRDVPAAADAWRRVIALAPNDWQAHNDLGAALLERRDWEDADAAFAAALEAAPNEPMVIVNRATLDVRRGRAGAALPALEACLARHPDFAPVVAGLGFALREVGRYDDAAAALRRAQSLAPDDATIACGLGRALLEGGAAEQASAVAKAYLRRRSGHAGALALEALARTALGDAPAVDRLLDYDRFVATVDLPVPDGFADIGAFNRALAAHTATHRTLVASPSSHATSGGGLHSGSLLVSPRGPVAAFEQSLRAAVATYWRALPDLPGHPFPSSRPEAAYFNMWCVVMQRGGHQIPHIHPEAWLSGVYYPQLPEALRDGDGDGWLEFGMPDRPFPSRLEPRVVRVRPREGLLVLFPSYFYHRTIPFDLDGTRISVAFDLMPAA